MSITALIKAKIEALPESEPFGYARLGISPDDFFTAAKALERLQEKGIIKRVSKGVFYKPKMSVFGALGPDYDLLLQSYLYEGTQRIGYVTGDTLYNQLNLTTQMAFRTKIATRKYSRKKVDIGWLKLDFVKAYMEVTEDNYYLLGILDAIKDIRQIPDTPVVDAMKILSTQIANLQPPEVERLASCALHYPPRVRALLGAMLSVISAEEAAIQSLKRSLNPASLFKIGISCTDLVTAGNWNIQ